MCERSGADAFHNKKVYAGRRTEFEAADQQVRTPSFLSEIHLTQTNVTLTTPTPLLHYPRVHTPYPHKYTSQSLSQTLLHYTVRGSFPPL